MTGAPTPAAAMPDATTGAAAIVAIVDSGCSSAGSTKYCPTDRTGSGKCVGFGFAGPGPTCVASRGATGILRGLRIDFGANGLSSEYVGAVAC